MITFLDQLWILVEEDTLTIGIHEAALNELGRVQGVLLPEESSTIGSERSFGEVIGENGQINLYSPFEGEAVEINEIIGENPSLINEDPYGEGWLVKIVPINGSDLSETGISSVEELIKDQL